VSSFLFLWANRRNVLMVLLQALGGRLVLESEDSERPDLESGVVVLP
jgi:hypothetical protein